MTPPDTFGIGRILGAAAALLVAVQLARRTRDWYLNRKRMRQMRKPVR